MNESTPALAEWRRLFGAAIRVKEIAPWKWMAESDVFGVQNPESDDMGFISVMGTAGEHFAVALYLGPKGLYGFWAFKELEAPGEKLFEIPHFQASFENREVLRKKDRDLIKELGLRFRGRHEWPMFRSFRPGFFPWYLEAWEARFLTHALEQTVDVTLRFREDPGLLTPSDSSADSYLVRMPREQEGTLLWEDQVVSVQPVEPEPLHLAMDVDVLDDLKRLPQSQLSLEMDLSMFPTPVQEKGARPIFPYMLLVVDGDSGFVFGTELLNPEPTLEAMWELVPLTVVYKLASFGIVPRQIKVRSVLLFQLLQPLAEELDFDVKLTPVIPALDRAKEFMTQRFF